MLFWVETRGVDSTRALPFDSSADSCASRLNAPLIEPSARPTALVAPAAARFTAVPTLWPVELVPLAEFWVPAAPLTTTLLGNARFVVLPSAGMAVPVNPHWMPSAFA